MLNVISSIYNPYLRLSLGHISFSDDFDLGKPFGDLVVVFGGDFLQILLVVPKGSRHDIVHASLCSSRNIWKSCTVLKLTKNMRLQVYNPFV